VKLREPQHALEEVALRKHGSRRTALGEAARLAPGKRMLAGKAPLQRRANGTHAGETRAAAGAPGKARNFLPVVI
jgi:hypothetical protein